MVTKTYFTKCQHTDDRLPKNYASGPTPKELSGQCLACDHKDVFNQRASIWVTFREKVNPLEARIKGLLRTRTTGNTFGWTSKDPDPGKLQKEIENQQSVVQGMIATRKADVQKSYDSLTPRWGSQSPQGLDFLARRRADAETDEDILRGIGLSGNAPLRPLTGS